MVKFAKPARLVVGKSVIGLIAPSGVVEKAGLETGIEVLKGWGFSVKLGAHVLAREEDYSAGSDVERAQDFFQMVADPQVGAIDCIVGGFAGTDLLRFLTPQVFQFLSQKPKIFFGYSDFCLILNSLFAKGLVSFHAPNVAGLYRRSLLTQKSLYLTLVGELPVEIGPLAGWLAVVPGSVRGHLLVSNLEGLVDLLGTPLDPLNGEADSLILALEEVGENKSSLSRWLAKLAVHSHAAKIKGLIIGRFTKISEQDYPAWGRRLGMEQIFLKAFGQKKLPIACLPEFGHTKEEKGLWRFKKRERIDFLTLPSGVEVLFKVRPNSCRLKFLEKAVG